MTDAIINASKKLDSIEQHVEDYEDEESIAPTPDVFTAVREFFKALSEETKGLDIPEPKLFVSPNGHIVVVIGNKPYDITVRFAPGARFCYQHPLRGSGHGEGMANALDVVKECFRAS